MSTQDYTTDSNKEGDYQESDYGGSKGSSKQQGKGSKQSGQGIAQGGSQQDGSGGSKGGKGNKGENSK